MPDKKKSALVILIISACTAFFLGRKYFSLSRTIEKNGQERENSLLSNKETTLLLNKIENMLGEATEAKKPDLKEMGRTFHLEVNPDEEREASSAIRKSADKQEVAGKDKKDAQNISQINPGSMQRQVREEWPSKKYGSDGQRAAASARGSDGSPAFHGGFIGPQKTDGSTKQDEPKIAKLDVTPKENASVSDNTSISGNNSPEGSYISPPSNDQAPDPNTNGEQETKKDPDDKPSQTPWSIDFFGRVTNIGEGSDAKEGTLVCAYDSKGKLCGSAQVKKNGLYGVLHIYVDDPGTEQKEGMMVGEPITFMIDGRIAIARGPDQAVCAGGSELKQVNLQVDLQAKS